MENDEIAKDLSIDKNALEYENLSQASVYFKYSDACAQAKLNVSDMSDKMKAVLAQRQIAIREMCATEGKKVTESVIAAMVDADDEVKDARASYREAEAVYAKLNVAVQALDVKRSSLDNLVKLYVSGYFTTMDSSTGRSMGSKENLDSKQKHNMWADAHKE